MNIWIIEYIFLGILAFVSQGENNKNRKKIYIIAVVSIWLLTVLRGKSVGVDWLNYYNGFIYISKYLPWESIASWWWEPGYVLLNKVVGVFTDDFQVIYLIIGSITIIPIMKAIYKYSVKPIRSLIVFVGIGFWGLSLGILRQWCAIGILSLSYKYILRRQPFKFLLIIILAGLFHRTAIAFVFIYPVMNIKQSNNKLVIEGIIASFISMFAGRPLLEILNHFARIKETVSFNGGINMFIFLWSTIILYLIVIKKTENREEKLFFRMLIMAAVLQPISFTFANWSRIVVYYSISAIYIIPTITHEINKQANKKIHAVIFNIGIYLAIGIFYLQLVHDTLYCFFWNEII